MSTSAIVNMVIYDNVSWEDAFQFGTDGDTSWSFSSKTFKMDVKASRDDTAVLLALTSGAGEIVVDDAAERILHLHVLDVAASLPPAEYVYDLIMVDGSNIETMLMTGKVCVQRGVTQS